MTIRQMGSHLSAILCLTLSVAGSSGCDSKRPLSEAPRIVNSSASMAESGVLAHSLTIYGYNYTDSEIGSFEVNGQGGGNILISTPTSGGGSSVCCLTVFTPMHDARPVMIKWTRDSDVWCEQEVLLAAELPPKPEYFEVHFYRDGHIELAVTSAISPPRLALTRSSRASRNIDEAVNVNNDSRFARCKRGYN